MLESINIHYVPDGSGVIAGPVIGDCQQPTIMPGDIIIVDSRRQPEVGDYVIYKHGIFRYCCGVKNCIILHTNHRDINAPAIDGIAGVVVQVNRIIKRDKGYVC